MAMVDYRKSLSIKMVKEMRIIKIIGLILAFGLLLSSVNAQVQKPDLVVQTSHSEVITTLAFSPKGDLLATGASDKTIKLWNVKTGKNLRTFVGHVRKIESIAFSPNGKIIASTGNQESVINLWDVETGQKVRAIELSSYIYHEIVFSPEGKTIAKQDTDGIKIWDVLSGKEIIVFENSAKQGCQNIKFSPDGERLASGCGQLIKIWDVSSGKELNSIRGHGNDVTSLGFSPDGKTIVSGCYQDKTIKLWNVLTGLLIKNIAENTRSNWDLKFSQDGKNLISFSYQAAKKYEVATINIWDIKAKKVVKTLAVNSDRMMKIIRIFHSPNDDIQARLEISENADELGNPKSRIIIWDSKSSKQLLTISNEGFEVNSVAFSPTGENLILGYGNALKLWDLKTGELRTVYETKNDRVLAVAYSSDGKIMATGSYEGKIKILNSETEDNIKTLNTGQK